MDNFKPFSILMGLFFVALVVTVSIYVFTPMVRGVYCAHTGNAVQILYFASFFGIVLSLFGLFFIKKWGWINISHLSFYALWDLTVFVLFNWDFVSHVATCHPESQPMWRFLVIFLLLAYGVAQFFVFKKAFTKKQVD